MVTDTLRGYAALAGGLVDVSRQQAVRLARALTGASDQADTEDWDRDGDAEGSEHVGSEQLGRLAEELLAASRRNRDAVLALVRHEIDRARERLGVPAAERVDDLAERVVRLEAEVASLRAQVAASGERTRSGTSRSRSSRASGSGRTGHGSTTRTSSSSGRGTSGRSRTSSAPGTSAAAPTESSQADSAQAESSETDGRATDGGTA